MSGNSEDFNRLRAQFSRRANAREIPPLASKLCWWIAFGHMDTKRRSTFVTQKTLANDLGGVTVRSVQRMIDVLKPLGLKVAPGHGPDKASTYWIGEPNTTSMSPIETDNTTSMSPIQPGQGDTGVGSRRHYGRQKATLVSRHIKNSKKISKKVSNKSAPPARSSADADRESIPSNSATVDDAPSIQRAVPALVETDAAQQEPPSATSIGTAANGAVGAHAPNAVADPERAVVFDYGRKKLGAGCETLVARFHDAERAVDPDSATERVIDGIDVAANEDDPVAYIENAIEIAESLGC